MSTYRTTRAGIIICARNVFALAEFYIERFDFELAARFEEPSYVILTKKGMRLSFTEDRTTGEDFPDFTFRTEKQRDSRATCLVLEVDDCAAARAELESRGVAMRSEIFRPPWGGGRFFCEDPEQNIIEIEEPA